MAKTVSYQIEVSFDRSKIERGLLTAAKEGIREVQLKMRDQIVAKLSTKGTGKHHSGLPNRSTRPGRPPAVQSGTLRDSWKRPPMKPKTKKGKLIGTLKQSALQSPGGVSAKKYGFLLERGTRNIKKRPFLKPVTDRMSKGRGNSNQVTRIMAKSLKKKATALNGAAKVRRIKVD